MKNILLIIGALVITAIILTPALAYTNQAAGNQSYSAKSGDKINYSLEAGVPAHRLTPEMVQNKYSFQAPAVQSIRVPYSFRQGAVAQYSFEVLGVENAAAQGMKTKEPALLGSMNTEVQAANETVAEPAIWEPKIILPIWLINETGSANINQS